MKVVNLKQISHNIKTAPTPKTENNNAHPKWNPKQKEKNEKIQSQSNKQNEDFDWLQKIVNQFSAYKDMKPVNAHKQQINQSVQYVQSTNNTENMLGNLKPGDNKSTCRSQRKIVVDSTVMKTKNQIMQNNLAFAKNSLRSNQNVKNRRSESQSVSYKKCEPVIVNIQSQKSKPDAGRNKIDSKLSEEQRQTSIQMNRKSKSKNQCQIVEVKADLAQVKAKLSMPEKNVSRDGNKAAIVKETRKNLINSIADNRNCFGRIVKNSSLQVKQRCKLNFSSGNLNIKNQVIQNNEIQQLLSRQDSKPKQQHISHEKQFHKIKLVQNSIEKVKNQKSEINKTQTNLILQYDKDPKKQSGKKFNYLTQKNLENRYDKLCHKRQRKLNSSFGEKKIICHDVIKLRTETQDINSNKYLRASKDQDKIMVQAFSPSQFNIPRLAQNQKIDIRQSVTRQISAKIQNKDNTFSNRTLEQKVKLVESTKNSMILTQHSVVIDKQPVKTNYETHQKQQQWNILQIFQKLDRKNVGVLAANNCAIENVGREIRYILGTVLEQILYMDTQYNLINFITRVEQSLETLKQSEILSKRSHYESNKYKPQQSSKGLYQRPKFQQQKSLKCSLSPLSHSQSSKKYEYTKLFVIDDVYTEPALKDRTSDKNKFEVQDRNKKAVRFATFQNEGDEYEYHSDKYGKSKNDVINLKQKQIKLEQKLKQLNQFKPSNPLLPSTTRNLNGQSYKKLNDYTSKQTSSNENYSSVRPRSRSYTQPHQVRQNTNYKHAENNEYRNEIVKLQLLNQRLEKYLHDQSMKEFSADKLFP